MNNLKFLSIILFLTTSLQLNAQVLYVDAIRGSDVAEGSSRSPLLTLQKAVDMANKFTGEKAISIKLAPGLYQLTSKITIQPTGGVKDTPKFIIEATVMPDDTSWQPAKMPVIQSIADTNSDKKFKYCVAFRVERNNVAFRGLKFLGNPRPDLGYFYAIERQNEKLKGLSISQCYFIGDKNTAPVQGGIFAQGADISVDHCIFYGCKNAVLVFLGLNNFSLTHSIINGAYEAAVWYGYGEGSNAPLTFSNNVVANCNYFWISDPEREHHYTFSNSLIVNNTNYMGLNGMEIQGPDLKNNPVEINVIKTGDVLFNEITAKGIPHNYLNLSPQSAGKELNAGIFNNK